MENRRLFGLICYVHREIERRNSECLSSFGISGVQLQTLVFVHRNALEGKKVCQRDIEHILNLRPSSVSTLISNLTAEGYVMRTSSEGDARIKNIELTQKGEELCLKNRELMDKCDEVIQNALNEEERAALHALLLKVIQNLES